MQRRKMQHDPRLDPELATSLVGMPEFTFSLDTLSALRELTVFPPTIATDVEQMELHTGNPNRLAFTVFRPRNSSAGPLGCLVWFHGGGLVAGGRHMDDDTLNEWCRTLDIVCVSVEYRLAPEAAYPLPLDDCENALRHVLDHAAEWGIDADRIGVGGRSAGAGLAATLSLRWREQHERPLAFQYLEYPMLDDRFETPSSRFDGLPLWNRESNAFGWASYLGGRAGLDVIPDEAAAARAVDLSNLPPTFLCVGTFDGLRDEVIDYATRLMQAGTLTELHVYAGAPHGFQLFADSSVARCAVADSANWLRRQLTAELS
jgi:acetyl esterase/lipase